MLVGFGVTGGKVGEGTSGFVVWGLPVGDCLGVGNSGAVFVLDGLLSLEFAFGLSSVTGVGEKLTFALAFALELTVPPPTGMPCSLCPVAGGTGCTA